MKGINNKILKLNLNKWEYEVDEHNDDFYRKYIGGRGFALYYMLKELEPDVEPLSPDNILVFTSSIIGGAPGPAIPRLIVCSKSPLTECFGETEAGGFWAPELKRAGFDAIVITGKSQNPVYLWIKDGQVEFKDARGIWGKETGETQNYIREELGDERIRIAQIGPGGERLVKYANITNELGHFNGRNGLGAVMGSKKLKAIAVRGTKSLPLADKQTVIDIARWAATEGMKSPLASTLHEIGTTVNLNAYNEGGILPTRNWNKGTFKDSEMISGETMNETIGKEPGGCFSCPIRCKRVVEVDEENIKVDPKYGGPEYETQAAFGPLLEINDLKVIAKANEICNKNTIDTISAGMTIAFAMECYENGLLTKEECSGLELNFGNNEAVLTLLHMIINREDIGDLLAEGSYRAAKKIGKRAQKFVHQVKGQEVPMHDPRVKTGVGLQYALSEYGADHMMAMHDSFYTSIEDPGIQTTKSLGIYNPVPAQAIDEQKVSLFVKLDIYWTMLDMLGICVFGYAPRGPVSVKKLIRLIQAVTGTDIGLYECMRAAERSINMARVFNLREGFGVEDDKLPGKFYEDFADGPLKGTGGIDKERFRKAMTMRYEMMGWDPDTARPRKAKLNELGLEWLLKENV